MSRTLAQQRAMAEHCRVTKSRPKLLSMRFEGALSPAEGDPRAALDVAAAFMDLVAAEAARAGRGEVEFKGLKIGKGSLKIQTASSIWLDDEISEAIEYVSGMKPVPLGLNRKVTRVVRSIERCPHPLKVNVRGKSRAVKVPSADTRVWKETLAIRAKVNVIGHTNPTVSFLSESEDEQFTLESDVATVSRIRVYSMVDIEATITRNERGRIVGGVLHDFHELEDGGTWEDIAAWARDNCVGEDEWLEHSTE